MVSAGEEEPLGVERVPGAYRVRRRDDEREPGVVDVVGDPEHSTLICP